MRLRRLEEEFGDDLEVAWRSFLLRPRADRRRTLEEFRTYTQSWMRPAADADAGTFRVWAGDAGPPSHSVPPHVAAKAAATLGRDAFRALHDRLLHAYFAESRDITAPDTLRALWSEAGLPAAEFVRTEDPALLEAVLAEHADAIEQGVTGVPAVRMDGNDTILVGAHPIEAWRRWIARNL